MGVTTGFLTSASLVRRDVGWTPGDGDVPWYSWLRWFQYAFIGFTLLAVVGAVTDNDASMREAIAGAVVGLALAGWLWQKGRWDRLKSNGDALLYFAVLIALLTAALRIYDGFGLAIFGAYWHGFAFLRIKPAMIYATVLTILIQVGFSEVGPTSLHEIDIGLPRLIGGIIGLLVAGMMAAYIEGLGREAERRRHLLNQLQAAQEALAVREREAGVAAERQRLAGEIHDTVAQHFTSIVTNLEAAESRALTNPDAAREHIRAAREAARQGIADARSMVDALQPQVLEGRTLGDALRHIATEYTPGSTTTFSEEGPSVRLDRVQETILVRALQESLQNTRKHAGARSVTVSLNWLADEVILDIQDDGAGFDPAAVPPSQGGHRMGLLTMRQRVETAGGTWMIESAPGEGTSLAISFPLDRVRQEARHA